MFNNKRIAALEKRIRELESKTIIKSYANSNVDYVARHGYYQRPLEIELHAAVRVIAEHLGMEFNVVEGTPERLVLQKKPKGK